MIKINQTQKRENNVKIGWREINIKGKWKKKKKKHADEEE